MQVGGGLAQAIRLGSQLPLNLTPEFTNSLPSLAVEEFHNFVGIWQSQKQEYNGAILIHSGQ